MNQLQVFILINVMPVLLLVIFVLLYMRARKKEKKWPWKIELFLFTVFSFWLLYKSPYIHRTLFPEKTCVPEGVILNIMPSRVHGIFNVPVDRTITRCPEAEIDED